MMYGLHEHHRWFYKKKKKYYAVSEGYERGIFTDAARYIASTKGFKGSRAKSFYTYEDALRWFRQERHASHAGKHSAAYLQNQSDTIKAYLSALDARRVLALDIEYTGFKANAEILQLSIINGLGIVICNQYFKPEHVTSWDETVPIHHITPEMVSRKPHFCTCVPQVNHFFSDAECIIGYSTMQDISLLHAYGVYFPERPIYFDAGEAYSYVTAEKNKPRTYAKLQDCAAHYGYNGNNWHDSLADTKATLFCFYALLQDEKALFTLHTFYNHKK